MLQEDAIRDVSLVYDPPAGAEAEQEMRVVRKTS
jgi:hypothetical protein